MEGKYLVWVFFQKRMGHGLGGGKETVGNIKRAESNNLVEIDLEHIFLFKKLPI